MMIESHQQMAEKNLKFQSENLAIAYLSCNPKYNGSNLKQVPCFNLVVDQFLLLGAERMSEIYDRYLKITSPHEKNELKFMMQNGSTVAEFSSYVLSDSGELGVRNRNRTQEARALAERVSQQKGSIWTEAPLFAGVASGVFLGGGAAMLAISSVVLSVSMLGAGAVDYLSPYLSHGATLLLGVASLRTVSSGLKGYIAFKNLRTKEVPLSIQSKDDEGTLHAATDKEKQLCEENLRMISGSDRHLLKHLHQTDLRQFLLGNDDVRKEILTQNAPSLIAQMQADISALDEASAVKLFNALKSSVSFGNGGQLLKNERVKIENLQDRLSHWREAKTDTLLPQSISRLKNN